MSTISNRIATIFTANAGNVRAVFGEVAGGMQNIGRAAMDTGRNSSYANSQLRAMATTLRYAVAGSVIFGTTQLIRNVSALQTQSALWASLGEVVDRTGRQINWSGGQIATMLDELQRGSVESLTPVGELANSVTNLLSSVQGVQETDVTKITKGLAEGAQFAQTPVEDLTKAVTSMNQAFGRTPTASNFEGLSRGFVTLTRRAPGGVTAGPQIVNQLGPLAAVSRLGHVSPQQMLGMLTTVLRFGGSPSTGARGLQFLLQSITAPNKEHRAALMSAGITPEFVQKFGATAAIQKLIVAARKRGIAGAGNLKNISDDQLDAADTAGQEGLAGLGVSGQGVQFLQQAIGRIHGVRALVALMSEMDTPKGNMFAEDIAAADRAIRGIGKEGTSLEDQFKEFRRRQPLRAAAIAIQGLALEVPRALEPVLNPVARVAATLAGAAVNHPKATRAGILGGAALVAALTLRRGLRGFGGAAGQTFVRERAITAATNPENAGVLGGSPQNPIYVTVVGQLFGGGTNKPDSATKSIENKLLGGGALAAAARFGLRVVPVGVAAGGAYIAGQKVGGWLNHLTGIDKMGGTSPDDIFHGFTGLFSGGKSDAAMRQRNMVRQANQRDEQIARLNRTLAPFHRRDPLYGVTAIYSQRKGMIHGKAEVILDVNLSTEKGVTRKRIHVPMDLWTNGRSPGSRGQPGKTTSRVP